jgi:hypothetical protein
VTTGTIGIDHGEVENCVDRTIVGAGIGATDPGGVGTMGEPGAGHDLADVAAEPRGVRLVRLVLGVA